MLSSQRQQETHSIQPPRRKRLTLSSLCLLTTMMIAYPLLASAQQEAEIKQILQETLTQIETLSQVLKESERKVSRLEEQLNQVIDHLIREGGILIHRFSHGSNVRDVEFSSDGRMLATASYKTARVYDLTTGQLMHRFEYGDYVQDVEFSSDGRMLATASRDDTARVYDLKTRQQLHRFEHKHWVLDVEFSSDGKLLTTASLRRDGPGLRPDDRTANAQLQAWEYCF